MKRNYNMGRQFQDKLQDPVLRAQIRGFIGQEANHTLEHIGLNALMARKGYSTLAMEQFVRDRIAGFLKEMTPEECLARTVALEHFTAIMASAFLSNPQELEKMDPRLAKLWAWHAIEEAEHKAVAFDLYKATVDDERLRLLTMLKVSWFFLLLNSLRTVKLMREGGQLFNLKAWAKGANVLWGRPGIFRKILPQYLDFFRRDFHPWQHNNMADLEVMKARYLKEF